MSDLTLTNRDIWDSLAQTDPSVPPPLLKLARLDRPIIVSNNLRKLLRKAREVFPDVSEGRDALIAKHAQRDADGKPVTFDEGRQTALVDATAYLADVDVLMALPVTLTDCHAVTIADLGAACLSGETLDLLGGFVVE